MADKKASIALLVFEGILIILFGILAKYDREADPKLLKATPSTNIYPMFQDIHVMIFVGFGFLMTFLRKYGFSAVGFNFLLSATMVQWGLIVHGIFSKNSFKIGLKSLIEADILVAAILISMGAVLGKTTPLQLLLMGIIEAVIYSANEALGNSFQVVDIGGSMFIHVFGAYFGLACSRALGKPKQSESESSSSISDLFAMIGTLFLWLFWPSFNAALSEQDDGQKRAIINTYLSISASVVTAFAISSLSSKENKFNMVHVQNATLAGGVAVGTSADLVIFPFGALLVGSIAGILSTLGYAYLQPFLLKKIGLHDTCGVNNLHGMPGILAGIVGCVACAMSSADKYGASLYLIFPARAPKAFTVELKELQHQNIEIIAGSDRSASEQALYQLLVLGLTLIVALVSGAITGIILRLVGNFFGDVPENSLFQDEQHWEIEESNNSNTDIGNNKVDVENAADNNTMQIA